ncbi:putative ceramide kinase [Apostichopus japonicus]|uniref:Putative ceramide kinase n=1 Tax=Stichopus japonicus TaxID=307972 RepID=A0A2G8JN14_STIJA|nr:putative ceramide kinase [Apostichopus japonicus]
METQHQLPFISDLCYQVIKTKQNILAVKTCESTGKRASLARKFSARNGLEIPLPHSLKVYSTKISRSGKWKLCKHCIVCSSQQQTQSLLENITSVIQKYVSLRPKHLMVIINPRGGRLKGEKIYQKYVANVFNLAEIKTDVFVTKYQEQARELVMERDLSGYDGIVGVGGDGTVHEIVNALLKRTQNEADLDLDDPEVKLIRPKFKVGIIPAGSTDVIAFDTTGVNDPVTSAVQIAQGFSVGLDVCSVHHNNYLLRYTLSFLGYGFFGDVVKESENYRWMGTNRYGLAGLLRYLGNRSYHGTVSYLPNDDHSHTPWDSEMCKAGCSVCKDKGEYIPLESGDVNLDEPDQNITVKVSNQWEMKHGEFNAINAAILSCTSLKAPGGLPAAHLGNGCVDLVLVKRCSRLQYLRYLLRISLNGNPLDLDYVEVHRVKAFKFQTTPLLSASGSAIEQGNEAMSANGETVYIPRRQASVSSTSSWNLDGEISDQPDIDVRVHCQLIQVFARGPEITEGTGSGLLCFH